MENFKTHRMAERQGSGAHGQQYEELDPESRKVFVEFFNTNERFFNAYLGLKMIDIKRGYAKLEVECKEHLCQPAMVMHGGASFGMADAAVAMALMGFYGLGQMMLTIEMKINYLEPIPPGMVVAEAHVLRASRSSAFAEVDIWSSGRLAARATSTYMIRPIRKS